MRDYTYSEIGMLSGAAIGGILSFIGYIISKNSLFFIVAAMGIAIGLFTGNLTDKKQPKDRKKEADL